VSNAGHYCLTLPSGWVDLASLRLTCHTCTDSWESNLSMGSLASLIVHAFSAHPITTSGPLLCVRNIASGESCLLTGDCMARCLLYNKLFCLARRNSVVCDIVRSRTSQPPPPTGAVSSPLAFAFVAVCRFCHRFAIPFAWSLPNCSNLLGIIRQRGLINNKPCQLVLVAMQLLGNP
uniref:Secreted protein n=1 Tax=Macrostomum lignano TaxID=282301 RepID=A0A1I8IQL8_9PLAT